MIIAAAITYGRLVCFVPAPARHYHVLTYLSDIYGGVPKQDWAHESEEQGFLTDTGLFLNRKEAMIHAKACGQFKRDTSPGKYNGDKLFSEDLW